MSVYNPTQGGGTSGLSTAPTALTTTGNINNQALATNWLIYTGTASVTLTGLVSTGLVNGQKVYITNNDTTNRSFTIVHQSASSSAANRIICPSAASFSLRGGFTAELTWNATASRFYATTQVITPASPLLFSGQSLSIQQASTAQAGYISSADYTTFYFKPTFYQNYYDTGAIIFGRSGPSASPLQFTADSTKFNYDETKERFGVGLDKTSLEATVHARGSAITAIPDVTTAGINLVAETPTGTISSMSANEVAPYCQRVNTFVATENAGGTGYVLGDVIDYQVYTQDDTGDFSVVYASSTVTIASAIASVDLTWLSPTSMRNSVANYRILKQVNGGGFIYGADVGTSLYLNDYNFTSTDTTISPSAPDFISNGSSVNYNAYGTNTSPSGGIYSSATSYPYTFTDANTGDAYNIDWNIYWNSPSTGLFIENGSYGYFSSSNNFIEAADTFTNATTPPPEHYGILANGFNLAINWELWGAESIGGTYKFSNNSYIPSPAGDPNNGQYYSIEVSYNTPSSYIRIIADMYGIATVGGATTPNTSMYYIDTFNFPLSGDTATTPTGYYTTVGLFEQYTDDATGEAGLVIRGANHYASFEFQDDTGTRMALIEVTPSGVVNFVASGVTLNGVPL